MIDPQSQAQLQREIAERMQSDCAVLEDLRVDMRELRGSVRRIQPRSTTAISLVGTDGGNNSIQFDPFLVQIVRVVDSSNNEYCLEAVTPTTSVSQLSARQFNDDGSPRTRLGEMMAYLGVSRLTELSHSIRSNDNGHPTSPSWVQVYRELVEWATLFSIIRNKDFGSDTLIVCDGQLRSKVFARDLFARFLDGIDDAIRAHDKRNRRNIYLVGVAKRSQVLTRYRLAMALENVLTTDFPAFVAIPRSIEEKVYIWNEYARGNDRQLENITEANKYVGGNMFLVKFGNGSHDPVWPIDIYTPQADQAHIILGYMLADAIDGFPVPFYPRCLQKAHENAALVDFDFDILQDDVFEGIRTALGNEAPVLDAFRFQDADPAQARYR